MSNAPRPRHLLRGFVCGLVVLFVTMPYIRHLILTGAGAVIGLAAGGLLAATVLSLSSVKK